MKKPLTLYNVTLYDFITKFVGSLFIRRGIIFLWMYSYTNLFGICANSCECEQLTQK